MKLNAIFWGLCAASAAAAQDPALVPTPDGVILDPGALTMPGAIVMLGYMIGKWKPTIRIEHGPITVEPVKLIDERS